MSPAKECQWVREVLWVVPLNAVCTVLQISMCSHQNQRGCWLGLHPIVPRIHGRASIVLTFFLFFGAFLMTEIIVCSHGEASDPSARRKILSTPPPLAFWQRPLPVGSSSVRFGWLGKANTWCTECVPQLPSPSRDSQWSICIWIWWCHLPGPWHELLYAICPCCNTARA